MAICRENFLMVYVSVYRAYDNDVRFNIDDHQTGFYSKMTRNDRAYTIS